MLKRLYLIYRSVTEDNFLLNLLMSVALSGFVTDLTYLHFSSKKLLISPIAAVVVSPYRESKLETYGDKSAELISQFLAERDSTSQPLSGRKFIAYETPLKFACGLSSAWLKQENTFLIADYKGAKILGKSDISNNCLNLNASNDKWTAQIASDNPLSSASKVVVLTMSRFEK